MEHLLGYFGHTALTWLVGLPLIGALFIGAVPRAWMGTIRRLTAGLMLLEFLVSLVLLEDDFSTADYRFSTVYTLVEPLGIQFKVGVDGMSLWLVLLATSMTPLALMGSWDNAGERTKEYAASFLLLQAAMVGAFVSLDLFLFYVFWELMLLPMYLLIGVWGGGERVYASLKFFLYTMLGSVLMLVAMLYVVVQYAQLSGGGYSFDITLLSQLVVERQAQFVLFCAFALAFAIKVPMFPLHTWLPDAHVQAPTGGSVVLAAVLLKLGAYGFIRFAIPLFPLAAFNLGPTFAVFAVIGIVYGAWCAWVQKDLKKLVAYSSVSHLGFVMLGIFSATRQGVAGSILQMVSHGISTGALFLLVGAIYERRHSRMLSDLGGLAKVMPVCALLFVIVAMSAIGLPGTNGFVGEFMILNGTFLSERLPAPFLLTLVAATGVVFAAVYMLHAVQKVFWGRLRPDSEGLEDLRRREVFVVAPLVALIFLIGLFPGPFLERMNPAVQGYLDHYDRKLLDNAERDGETRLSQAALASSKDSRVVAVRHVGETR